MLKQIRAFLVDQVVKANIFFVGMGHGKVSWIMGVIAFLPAPSAPFRLHAIPARGNSPWIRTGRILRKEAA
jgi:hypothetical protein